MELLYGVPASVPAVVVAPVAIAVTVPPMVVVVTAAAAVPVTFEVETLVIVRRNPTRATVRWSRPVAVVPSVVIPLWIPVPVDPDELRTRPPWNHANNAGPRRGTNVDSERHLRRLGGTTRQNHGRKKDRG